MPDKSTRPTAQQGDADRGRADAAIEQAVAAFMKKIETLMVRWETVEPSYVTESALVAVCTELSRLTDDPVVRNHAGPATVKLAVALADYRDALGVER